MNRILVIRGGAIGDFILTLPTLKALRDRFPAAHIEILGYQHIAVLAEQRFYAQAVRSIEYAAISGFFAKDSVLSSELREYFAGFDLIISYLYDPDQIFETNLRRAGARKILIGLAKIDNHSHAARQLAEPITKYGIDVADFTAKIFPSTEDRQFAREFLAGLNEPTLALHPGSGSEQKNWPLQNWIELGDNLPGSLIIVAGEADTERATAWQDRHVRFAKNLPLPQLAAVLTNTIFVGHDSGISHLAAAVGAKCILLFGPTDPNVWAPLNENVRVIRAPNGDLRKLDVDLVREALRIVA
ncbi:MAG: glycosyltransferase family 9 protein [Spartobacteria bacterium]